MLSSPTSPSRNPAMTAKRNKALTLVILMFLSTMVGLEYASWEVMAVNDQDGDGLSYGLEYLINTQPQDPDSDNDGLPDGWEWKYGLNPNDGSSIGGDGATGDPDGDGMTNLQEYSYLEPSNWDIASTTQLLDNGVWWNGTVPVRNWDEENSMQYSQPSCGDPGSDGSGSIILCDEDPVGNICSDGIDNDRDGLVDSNDADFDGDADCSSNDDDGDGIADEDVDGWDTDGDGMPDGWEAANGLNATSASNNDGYFGDPDGDGLINIYEYVNPSWTTQCSGVDCWRPGPSSAAMTETTTPCDPVTGIGPNGCQTLTAEIDGVTSTDPQRADTDGDGLNDSHEALILLTDPTNSDTDNDGIGDGTEVNGMYGVPPQASNPRDNNTDGDQFDDGDEDLNGNGVIDANETDPTRREDSGDFDNDGLENWEENMSCTLWNVADTDSGGVNDGDERNVSHNTDPCNSMVSWVQTTFSFNAALNRLTVANGSGFNPNGGTGFYNDSTGSLTAFNYAGEVNGVLMGVSPGPPGSTVSVESYNGSWCHTSASADGTINTWRNFCDDDMKDSDGDGLADWQELLGTFGWFSNPFIVDTDGDGVNDYDEVMSGTDPVEPCWNNLDSDSDGINDYFETSTGCDNGFIGILNGSFDAFVTDPTQLDTDAGGIDDRQEYFDGTNPENDPADDIHLVDTDGDGIPDDVENMTGTDWRNPDTDGGGMLDGAECPKPFWFTNCAGSPFDPWDPTDDIIDSNTIFWANNTTGVVDPLQTHFWRVHTYDHYTGAAYASLDSVHPSEEIFGPYGNATHLADPSFANDSVTWQINYQNPVSTGPFPLPAYSSNITFWFDTAVQVQRSNDTHRYEVIGGALMEIWSIQNENFFDATTQATSVANSSSVYELILPPELTNMSTAESVVYNITNAVINDAGASTAWEKADALADFLINGNASTEFKINFNGSQVPDQVDISHHMLAIAKEGTCSEFTTLFTTMARLAGLPARKVSGYIGGYWSGSGYTVGGEHYGNWAEVNMQTSPASGGLDLGWVPFQACPPAATMEVVNQTANPMTYDRNGTTQFGLTGQLRFADNQTVSAWTPLRAYLMPADDTTGAYAGYELGATITDGNGTFTLNGTPGEPIPPGFGVIVYRPVRMGYVPDYNIVSDLIINVTDDPLFTQLTPGPMGNPVIGAGANTTLTGMIQYENPPQEGVEDLGNLSIYLEYTSMVDGTVNQSTTIGQGGIWSFDISLPASEPLGNMSSELWFPGWKDTSIVVAGSPTYNLRPLNQTLILNVDEAPNITATLEGPTSNNSILIVDDFIYVNGTALSRGTTPMAMNGSLELALRQNGTGGLFETAFNITVNGSFALAYNLTAANAQIAAGPIDVRLRFYPSGLEATDDANLSGSAWWLKGLLNITFSSNAAMRGGDASVVLDFYDHRGSPFDLNLTGDFASFFNGNWTNTSSDLDGSVNIVFQTPATMVPGDYNFSTQFNGSQWFMPTSGNTTIRIQGTVAASIVPAVEWIHIGDVGWLIGSVTDATLGGAVLNNGSQIEALLIDPLAGPTPIGSGSLNTTTGDYNITIQFPPMMGSGVYTVEVLIDFNSFAPPGGPYYMYIDQTLPSTSVGIESEAVLSIADVPNRLVINEIGDFIIKVSDVASGENITGAVVNYVFDYGNSNTTIGQATSDAEGNATLTWQAQGFDPGAYTIQYWMANDTTDNLTTPGAQRFWGNTTSSQFTLQAPTMVNVTQIPNTVIAGQNFNVVGHILDQDNNSRPLVEAVNIDIYWADNPGEKLIGGQPTNATGAFNFSVPTDSSSNGTTRGNHFLVIEVVNGSSPYYLTANASHNILVMGVSAFEGMQPLNAVIINRGSDINITSILVESSDMFRSLPNQSVSMRFDETWMPAEQITDEAGSVTFSHTIPFDQSLGLVNVTFFYNGSSDLLSTNNTLSSITVRSLTFLVVNAIADNPIAGSSFNVSGSISSDNGSALMSRDGTPLIANVLFRINSQLGDFIVANGTIQADGSWMATITLNDDFAAGNHTLEASFIPTVNFYENSNASQMFDSRGYSLMSFIYPALDQFGNPTLNSRTLRGDDIEVYVHLVDNTMTAMGNATIDLQLVGTNLTYQAATAPNGTAAFTVTVPFDMNPGYTNLDATFLGINGTTGILGSTANSTFVVLANTTTNITLVNGTFVAGEVIHIEGTLLDDLGNPLYQGGMTAPGVVHLVVDGLEVRTAQTDADTGAWFFDYAIPMSSGAGAHSMMVEYTADGQWGAPGSPDADQENPPFYTPSNDTASFNVSVPTEVRLAIAGGDVDREELLIVNGSLVDIVGLPLDGRVLEVWLGGVFLTNVSTDSNGAFSLLYSVPADATLGPNTLVFEFRGETFWLPSNASGTWNVYSNVGVTVSTVETAAIGDNVSIIGFVGDNQLLPLEGHIVDLYVDGILISQVITDENGNFSTYWNIQSSFDYGQHEIVALAPLQGWYREGTGNTTIWLAHRTGLTLEFADSADATRGDFWNIQGQLYDDDAPNDAGIDGEILSIYLDGVLISTVLSTNGGYWATSINVPMDATRGQHQIEVVYEGDSAHLGINGTLAPRVWADVVFEIDSISEVVTRFSSSEVIRITGRLVEVGGQSELVTNATLRLGGGPNCEVDDEVRCIGMGLPSWYNGGFTVTAVAPTWMHGGINWVTLEYPGNSSAYLNGAVSNNSVTVLLDVSFSITLDEIVAGNPDKENVRGLIVATADDTQSPVQGIQVWVELVVPNGSNRLEQKTTNDEGGIIISFDADPAYADVKQWGHVQVVVTSDDPILSNASKAKLAAEYPPMEVNYDLGGSEDTTSAWTWVLLTLIVAALGAGAFFYRKRKMDALKEIEELFAYTAELLAAGDEIREAIFGCYEGLCRVLQGHGFLRHDFETVREFERAIRQAVPIREDALLALDQVFELARYSRRELGEAHKMQAQQALSTCSQEIQNITAQQAIPAR